MSDTRLFPAFLLTLVVAANPSRAAEPSCKAAAGTEGCFVVHGRIAVSNGIGPNMWRIGTTRRYALFIDEAAFPTLERFLTPNHLMFGTFLVCPQSPDVPGEIRSVCLARAGSLVVQAKGPTGSPSISKPRCPECRPPE